MNTIFCSNLSFALGEAELRKAFEPFGAVQGVRIVQWRGFGFVDMSSEAEAEKAIAALDGAALLGRALRCQIATSGFRSPRTP
jgi:RNA recognition motif-containing protein